MAVSELNEKEVINTMSFMFSFLYTYQCAPLWSLKPTPRPHFTSPHILSILYTILSICYTFASIGNALYTLFERIPFSFQKFNYLKAYFLRDGVLKSKHSMEQNSLHSYA
jgi:hypothetical protein